MLGFIAYGTEPLRIAGAHRYGYDRSILRIDVRAPSDVFGHIRRFDHLWHKVWLSGRERFNQAILAVVFWSFLAVLILVPLIIGTAIVSTATVGHAFQWAPLTEFATWIHPQWPAWRYDDPPRLWSLFTACVIAALLLFVVFVRDTICTIDLYFLGPNEPFPLIALDAIRRYILAVRLLEPNVTKRANEYVKVSELRDFADRPQQSDMLGRLELYGATPQEGRMVDDVWMLVRFAISRVLVGSATELVFARSFRFAFKVHLPQIKAFLILLIMALVLPLSGIFGTKTPEPQYSLLLGTLGFIWAYWAIHLHRDQQRALVLWEQEWAKKPFSGCPMFFFDPENNPEQRWEELSESHFEVPIGSYGLRMQDVLQIALGILLVSYLTLLQLIK